jgi:glycosyltransferase involved in cell wall biosynthesis
MQKDPRIVLYQNEENKGALYSKVKGILNSKGKYVMILDHDDLYI